MRLDLSFTGGYPLRWPPVGGGAAWAPTGVEEQLAAQLEEARRMLEALLPAKGQVFFVGSELEFVRAWVLRVLRRGGTVGMSAHCDPRWRDALRADGLALREGGADLWITAAIDPVTGECPVEKEGQLVLCDARWWHLSRRPLPEADFWVLGAENWGVPPGACAILARRAEDDSPHAWTLAPAWREALQFWSRERERVAKTLETQTRLWRKALASLKGVQLHPGGEAGISWVETPGIPGDLLVAVLRRAGLGVSTGTQCGAGVPLPPSSLLARGWSERRAREGFRVAMHWDYGEAERETVVATLREVLARLTEGKGDRARHAPRRAAPSDPEDPE